MKRFLFVFLLIQGGLVTAQELWLTNAEEAFTLSSDQDLPLMMVFSGSDWCKPCIQLHQEIFETDMFEEFARNTVILLKVDFPKARKNRLDPERQQQNNLLADTWNPHGEFPLVVVLSSDREVLFTTGYRSGGPASYIQHLADQLSTHESNP